jgi:hypothetical protein
MLSPMEDILIWAVAALFALMGLYALAVPALVLEPFGVKLESPDGRNEVRAVYGGFGLAVAGVLVAAALDAGEVREGVLVAIGFALAGMAFGRLVSGAVERPSGFYPIWFYFVVELVGAGVLLAVAWA